MNTNDTLQMMLAVCDAAVDAKEELCRLDSFVGDGDHGFTVERGFKAAREVLSNGDFKTPQDVVEAVGDELADTMGGAIGLIIGGLFTGGSEAMSDGDEIGAGDFAELLSGGLEEIKLIGGAKEGDRTLIDALSPASAAFSKAYEDGKDLSACFSEAADAAEEGSKATADMVAKKGRAKFLQEASKGHVDAGSVTMALIIRTMSNFVAK